MNPVSLIERKRDGEELTLEEYRWFITGLLDGDVADAQAAALMMAGLLRGFTTDEARSLTTVLLESGEQLDLSDMDGPTVDKHSTGGVADGTTLIVAPLLAAAGAQVVKLSGRGLSHTGGTLDKLEAIPGLTVSLPLPRIKAIADEVGCVIAAQTPSLVPADKALYALRDVTGTVPSTALIASSVMSKKLASGADTIVLDVKVGDGAFMSTRDDATALAGLCVEIGVGAGRRTRAIVSSMDTPLGRGVGNGLEVIEAVHALREGPTGRLGEVCLTLAALGLAEATGSQVDQARERIRGVWASGHGLERLRQMVRAQGGEERVCDDPVGVLPQAPVRIDVPSITKGVVARVPARAIGAVAMDLGAGRRRPGDDVDPAVGVELLVGEGDTVELRQPLARIFARDDAGAAAAARRVGELIEIGDHGEAPPAVLAVI